MIWHNFWRRRNFIHWALLPLSWIFGALSALRRGLYAVRILSAEKITVPVVVVGNIVVGGGGKTPLVIAIVAALQQRGWNPGIASRGVGGSGQENINRDGKEKRDGESMLLVVNPKTPWQQCGDEPLLIHRRTGAAVCVCKNRARAARELQSLGCDIIICDDGLQHYALARDIEICAINASFGLGNGFLLPAGPLRESAKRLSHCNGIAICGAPRAPELSAVLEQFNKKNKEGQDNLPVFDCAVQCDGFYSVNNFQNDSKDDSAVKLSAADFADKSIAALAGIAEPARFFALLRDNGIVLQSEHSLPDHARMDDAALNSIPAECILMTEKDAVKYAPLANAYYARISLTAPPQMIDMILDGIKK